MLTGKIYKNKLSTPEQPLPKQAQETRQLARVKSQPGIKFAINSARFENAENIEQGTVKNQRDKIYGEILHSQYLGNHGKGFVGDSRGSVELGLSASDQVLEYERKMREHVQKIQEKYETKIAYMEATLQSKNQIISQLKTALKEKEKIIQKLEHEKETWGSTASRPDTSRYC